MRKIPFALALIVLVSGCPIPEEDYPEAYGNAYCDRLKECDKASFENTFDDMDECVADMADVVDFWMNAADLLGGDYSDEAARECITEVRSASCGDFGSGDYDCAVYE
jgi:hypothetical protein